MDIHPDIEPIVFLLGTWSGPGRGDYPTIEAFEYVETVTYETFGKPFIAYTQRTRGAEGPLHAEAGYIRCVDAHTVEHNFTGGRRDEFYAVAALHDAGG